MFLVTYNFGDMPINHMTFLRHRIFLVPVEESTEGKGEASPGAGALDRKKILCYLIHLRFQSSKSGKIYLHNDIRLLFSRKSIEVDTGIPYELKSFTEVPRNPKYSPRVWPQPDLSKLPNANAAPPSSVLSEEEGRREGNKQTTRMMDTKLDKTWWDTPQAHNTHTVLVTEKVPLFYALTLHRRLKYKLKNMDLKPRQTSKVFLSSVNLKISKT